MAARTTKSRKARKARKQKPKKLVLYQNDEQPVVGVIMGSQTDMKAMQKAGKVLREFGIPHELRIVSAHRTPRRMVEYAETARGRGIKVIIAGAGGSAHLPGMVKAFGARRVIGVPMKTDAWSGLDSLLSMVQMPSGTPLGTMPIGKAGPVNAALLAAEILATYDDVLADKLQDYYEKEERSVAQVPYIEED